MDDIFAILGRYNQGVNERMKTSIGSLNDEEWNRNLGGYFNSVRALCSHIYIADFNWLKRFGNLRSFKTLSDEIFKKNIGFGELLFPSVNEYLEKRPLLDEKISGLAGELLPADFSNTLHYNDSEGNPYDKNFGGAVFQMFNHETHHRGMISLYLELLGRKNDFSSVLTFFKTP
jgi:uncharacterized damage-inducible protein DinB